MGVLAPIPTSLRVVRGTSLRHGTAEIRRRRRSDSYLRHEGRIRAGETYPNAVDAGLSLVRFVREGATLPVTGGCSRYCRTMVWECSPSQTGSSILLSVRFTESKLRAVSTPHFGRFASLPSSSVHRGVTVLERFTPPLPIDGRRPVLGVHHSSAICCLVSATDPELSTV